jgi:hypothetical protein
LLTIQISQQSRSALNNRTGATRNQAFCNKSEDLRGDRQGIPYPEDSHVPSEPVTMDQLKDLFQAVLDCKSQTASDGAENGPAGPEKKAENNSG